MSLQLSPLTVAARHAAGLTPATLAVYADPLDAKPALQVQVPVGRSIASLLPAELAHEVIVCRYQGQWILRADWKRPVLPGDMVEFHARPQGGDNSDTLRTVLVIVLIVVAAMYGAPVGEFLGFSGSAASSVGSAVIMIGGQLAINAILPAQQASIGGTPETSPTYNVALSGNTARLDGAIPVMYGYNRTYPDFSAQPYTEFDNATNDQYYHAILCVGHGDFSIPRIEIDDTPLSTFGDVTYTVLAPGVQPTLVHPAVVTAPEVSGQELLPGTYVGAFVACASKTVATDLAFDLSFNGLGIVNTDGSVSTASVGVRFEARPVDDFGRSTGAWFVLGSITATDSSASVVRRSYSYTLTTAGRYKVRAVRLTAKNEDRNNLNTPLWTGLRAYLQTPATVLAPSATHIEIKMRATDQLNGLTQRRISVVSLRKLRAWSSSTGWSAPAATRNPAWALADKWTNAVYGDGLPDSRCDLATLASLAALWDARQDRLDILFDSFTDSDSADQLMAGAGRSAVIRRNGVRTVVRDGAADMPVTAFTSRSIRPGSWSCPYDLSTSDSPDGYIVEYWDNRLNDWATIDCPVPGVSTMAYPLRERVLGVTGAKHAEREGLYKAARLVYRRRTPSWSTELLGTLPAFGSAVVLAPALPGWGQGGDVVAWDLPTLTMSLSEPPVWTVGATHYISLQRDDGSLTTPIVATAGPDSLSAVLASAPDFALVLDAADRERPKYVFGKDGEHRTIARMLAIEPGGTDDQGAPILNMTGVIEDDRVHTADNALLPVGDEVQDEIDLDPVTDDDDAGGLITGLGAHTFSVERENIAASVGVSFGNDGRLRQTGYHGATFYSEWALGTITSGQAAAYELRATLTTGSVTSGDSFGVWLNLGTARNWTLTQSVDGTSTAELLFEIQDAATSTLQASATIFLEAIYTTV